MSFPDKAEGRSLQELASRRVEIRFQGTTEPNFKFDGPIKEVLYPKTHNTTIYFGEPERGSAAFPQNASIRLRFRSATPSPDLFVLDPSQPCTFEMKVRSKPVPGVSDTIQKHSVEGLTVGEVIQALSTPENYDRFADYPNGQHIPDLIREHCGTEITKLAPSGIIEYKRRHFEDDEAGIRTTFDSDINLWTLVRRGDDWFGRKVQTLSENIVEIKATDTDHTAEREVNYTGELMRLFGENHDYKPLVNDRKRDYTKYLLEYGRVPHFVSPEKVSHGENEWHYIERELKIDVDTDPRDALQKLPQRLNSSIFLGVPTKRFSLQHFILLEDREGIAVMTGPDDPDTLFKGKVTLPSAGDMLTRTEIIYHTRDEVLEAMGYPTDKNYPTTVQFTRERIHRRVVCADTGNVFIIMADHCVAEDNRKPLDQLEIEYLGRFLIPGETLEPDVVEIENDTQKIKDAVLENLAGNGVGINDTGTRKIDWITNNF